jgi:hypothetical protein
MSYTTTKKVWEYLGKDAYTQVRGEVLGTGNGTASSWTASQVNLISASTTLYTNSAEYTGSYTLDLDNGRIEYTASNNVILSMDYNYADVPDSQISDLISQSDEEIELRTGRKFTQVTGNIEYISLNPNQCEVFLKNYPVLTLSYLETRKNDTFEVLTEGYTEDYIATAEDLSLGRIRFNTDMGYGNDMLRATYDYGYVTTPTMIEELSKLLTIRQLSNSTVYKSIFKGYDNFTPVRLEEIESRIEELFALFTRQEINSI